VRPRTRVRFPPPPLTVGRQHALRADAFAVSGAPATAFTKRSLKIRLGEAKTWRLEAGMCTRAAPRPRERVGRKPDLDGIARDISRNRHELLVAFDFVDEGMSAKQVGGAAVATVVLARVGRVEVPERVWQTAVQDIHDRVVVVAHERVADEPKLEAFARFRQGGEKACSVIVVEEEVSRIAAMRGEMEDPGRQAAGTSCHPSRLRRLTGDDSGVDPVGTHLAHSRLDPVGCRTPLLPSALARRKSGGPIPFHFSGRTTRSAPVAAARATRRPARSMFSSLDSEAFSWTHATRSRSAMRVRIPLDLVARTPAEILSSAHTIALVGASPRPERPSHQVMRYLLEHGFRVIPVRPHRREILGVPVASSLSEIDEPIDLVDVFRRAEFCPGVAEEAVAVGAKGLWLQLGLVSPDARAIAERAGLEYVENECTAIVHSRLQTV
jgi:predicted CoA-binding protein